MELWDAYDRDMKLLGVDLIRGEPIPDGMYHLVSEVIIRHTDGEFLIMKRDENKQNYPGLLQATAGGSALKGEKAEACIYRELKEETGIIPTSLHLVDIIISDEKHTIYYEFYGETDCEKNSVHLQKGETVGFRWVDKQRLTELLNDRKMMACIKDRLSSYFQSYLFTRG